MTILPDTHVWYWSMGHASRLSQPAVNALRSCSPICISSITLFEMGLRNKIGKWPELDALDEDLRALAAEHGIETLNLNSEICRVAAFRPWEHRDPFDRLIAASAMVYGLPLITADRAFHEPDAPEINLIW